MQNAPLFLSYRTVILTVVLAALSWSSAEAALVFLDFETGTSSSNQYTSNFRFLFNQSGGDAQTDPADVGEPNNDYGFYDRTGAASTSFATTLLYDTTPANTADAAQTFSGPITISLDYATVNATSGVGIYLVDPANASNNIGVFSQLDASGVTDRMSLRVDADLGAGGTGTQVGSNADGNSGIGISSNDTPAFVKFTLTYTPGTTSDTLSASLGNYSTSFVLTDANRLGAASFMLALRLNDTSTSTNTSVKFDNLEVVPEPGPLHLLAAGCLMLLARRRSRRLAIVA